MRRSLMIAFAAYVPLAGITVLAARDVRGQQPVAPPKAAAPKERDAAPKGRDSGPVAPRDRDAAPRDTAPPTARQDSRQSAPGTRAPSDARDNNHAPRDPTRTTAPNANDANRRDATRDSGRREHRSDRDLGITFGRVTDRGLAVNNLTANSALVRGGLRAGDIIVSVNGHRLERSEDFDRVVFEVGDVNRIAVVVFRDGREEVVYLEPTIFYADDSYVDDFAYFGVVFDDRYPDRLIVLRVYPDSPAFIAGLREGDEITTWHGQRIHSPAEFGRILHRIEPGNVDFEFSHDRQVVRAQAKFNERVAAREKTGAGANDRQPADNGNPQPDRQPRPGAAPNPQPASPPRTQGPAQPSSPPSAPNVAPNRQPGAQPGAAPGGQPPAPRNAPGGRQPAAPNQPSGPAPAAGPGGQQPQPPRNPPAGSPQADR
jgi:membrane-associated protease RseP (regulator of RpoE activity)